MKSDKPHSGLIDISQPVAQGIPVWPGDTVYQPFWVMQMERGDSCNVGSTTMSLHTGTHADAPLHFQQEGASIGEVDLAAYIGPALVVDVLDVEQISADNLRQLPKPIPERLLFKTRTGISETFDTDFCYLSTDAAEMLVQLGMKLIGMDTPSVDKFDSKSMDSHHILTDGGVAILENLALQDVNPGAYELIALPLKLVGMDASPVRAVLRIT